MLFFANNIRLCTDFQLDVWPDTGRKVCGGGGWLVSSELSVQFWSKPFHSSLSFGLGPSRTIHTACQ